jgi:hypothetical protein
MNLFDLYKEENKDLLYCISWLNKNSIFDKSIGEYKNIDLFTFLENINRFDYEKDIYFDDIYYILEYTKDSILYLINNINKEIKREHKIVPISQAKEFDKTSLLWISRQNGRTLKEKLSNGKIKSVQRYKNIDTYENRIFKTFLKMLVEVYELRNDINEFEQLFIKIRRWLKTDEANSIDEYKKIVYNNLLLHHPHYNKIFKSYKKVFNLGNKYDSYLASFPKQIYLIIKFEVLTQLQFKTNMAILPKNIEVERNFFEVELFNPLTNIDLDELMKNVYKKYINNFSLIRSFVNSEIKSLAISNRTFKIDTNNMKEVFIDLFRLFPIANINNEIVNFPIILKQEIDGNIINANNTKIIDLNYGIYTLPELLDNYNVDVLKYFLEDMSQIFNKTRLNYIIPDYVNIFQFTESKRMINTYFKDNKPIPKSILAGLKYLFSKDVKQDDTLIYIQRNHHNELYVTPLLVKFDSKLENITQGFYLERYPTKKIGLVDDDLFSSLNTIFDEKYSKILLNKFLQNGLKGIKKENIIFYKDNKVIDLSNLEIPLKVYDDIEKIRNLYNSKNLFNSNCKTISDTNEENLSYFTKLLEFEKIGYRLWREHLPDLSMEIINDGVYEQFSLVNEHSELIEKTVKIDNHFLIPLGEKELSFPLIFGDEKINYKAYLTSQDFPYNQHVECQLKLTYDFERENPYELTFIPLNKEYKDINAQWKKQNKDIILPIPNYPEKKSWEDFKKDPKRDGSGYSDLLDWILERLELLKNIHEVPQYIIDNERNKIEGYFENWGKDKNNKPFCFINVNGKSLFCHSNFFQNKKYDYSNIKQGDKVFLNIEYNEIKNNYIGKNIVFANNMEECLDFLRVEYDSKTIIQKVEPIIKSLKSIRYPLLTVWNNHTLTDRDVPDYFREHMYRYIELSLNYMKDKNVPLDFKKELFNFLSHLNQDMPVEIANTLVKYSKDLKDSNNLALAIGNADLDWQEQVLENIFNHFNKYPTDGRFFDILAIALWRSEILISKISQSNVEKVIRNLVPTIQNNFKTLKEELNGKNIGQLIKKIELLLGILRARSKFDFLFPHESLTLEYIKILDEIIKYIINENINLKTRIKLDIVKPDSFFKVPDILYAIRVYLTADTGAANSIKVLGVSDD